MLDAGGLGVRKVLFSDDPSSIVWAIDGKLSGSIVSERDRRR
jgi:hypothetical protein